MEIGFFSMCILVLVVKLITGKGTIVYDPEAPADAGWPWQS